MKNSEEMVNSLLERRDQYVAEQRKKRKSIVRITSAACSFVLVALLGVGVWQSGMLDQTPPAVIDNSGISLEQPGNNQQSEHITSNDNPITTPSTDSHNPGRGWTLNVNNIVGTISGAKMYYDPALYYNEVWDTAKMAEYLGVDVSAIGNGLTYSGSGKFTVTISNNGTIAYDTAAYGFNGDDIEILISKIGLPFDCIYSLESDNKTMFKLNNGSTVSVLIGARADGLLYADFEYNGLNYRVTAKNSSETQFAEIVKNTMELSVK